MAYVDSYVPRGCTDMITPRATYVYITTFNSKTIGVHTLQIFQRSSHDNLNEDLLQVVNSKMEFI